MMSIWDWIFMAMILFGITNHLKSIDAKVTEVLMRSQVCQGTGDSHVQ
jgi:hypothetical protein